MIVTKCIESITDVRNDAPSCSVKVISQKSLCKCCIEGIYTNLSEMCIQDTLCRLAEVLSGYWCYHKQAYGIAFVPY